MEIMRIFVHYCVLVLYFLKLAQCYQLENYDLPGIFSKDICTKEDLKATLGPFCDCKQQWNVTDLDSLCRVHGQLGECVHEEMIKAQAKHVFINGYIHYVFGKGRLKLNLDHLCRKQQDASIEANCKAPINLTQCNAEFESELDNLSEETACSKTKVLSKCFWDHLKPSCSASTAYFWWKLAESHLGRHCTKYGKERGAICMEIHSAFYPNDKSRSQKECRDAVHIMKECLIMERLDSMHHADILANVEFDIEKYVQYQLLTCEIEMIEEKQQIRKCSRSLTKQLRLCQDSMTNGMENQKEFIRIGQNVTVAEICMLYTNATQCYHDVLHNVCPGGPEHYTSLLCGSMPASCRCPEIAPRRGQSSSATIPQTFITYSFQRLFIISAVLLLIIIM